MGELVVRRNPLQEMLAAQIERSARVRLDRHDRMVVTEANGPGCALTPRGPTQEAETPMPDNHNTRRKYALTRLRKGDYLLPSNDAATLWRIYTYEEDGSAENWEGRIIRGTFWALVRRPMPGPNQLLDLDEWDEWQFWAGPFSTREEAISEAMRCA